MQKFLDFEDCFSAVGQNIMWNEANNQQPPKNEKKTKFQGGSIEGFFISFFFFFNVGRLSYLKTIKSKNLKERYRIC